MTPEQTLKLIMLTRANVTTVDIDESNVDELFQTLLVDEDLHWDEKNELRQGDCETELPCEWSRHYESKSVAVKAPNGRWVGWTYWYGGGKHGEPEAIDWMDEAYFLDCVEQEKLVTVRTFSKIDEVAK